MRTKSSNRSKPQRGASLVEYSLLVSLIALVSLGAVRTFGGTISEKYVELNQTIVTAAGNVGGS